MGFYINIRKYKPFICGSISIKTDISMCISLLVLEYYPVCL